MNTFQKLVSDEIKCEICGSGTIALYGCGWDNDRILCLDNDCGSEYIFPTSTLHFLQGDFDTDELELE